MAELAGRAERAWLGGLARTGRTLRLPMAVLAGANLKRRRLTESGVTGLTSLTGLTSRIGHTRTGLTSHARTALAGPRVRRGTGTRHALSWATMNRKSLTRGPLSRGTLSWGTLSRGPLTWEILTRETLTLETLTRGSLTGETLTRDSLTWETLTWETLSWAELGLGLLAEEALDGQALARPADVTLHR